jgi:hypothetical protein
MKPRYSLSYPQRAGRRNVSWVSSVMYIHSQSASKRLALISHIAGYSTCISVILYMLHAIDKDKQIYYQQIPLVHKQETTAACFGYYLLSMKQRFAVYRIPRHTTYVSNITIYVHFHITFHFIMAINFNNLI